MTSEKIVYYAKKSLKSVASVLGIAIVASSIDTLETLGGNGLLTAIVLSAFWSKWIIPTSEQ
jgi:hypothetical protein